MESKLEKWLILSFRGHIPNPGSGDSWTWKTPFSGDSDPRVLGDSDGGAYVLSLSLSDPQHAGRWSLQ